MYYTVLDEKLDKVFRGSYQDVRIWLESKTYKEVYYVFDHHTKEFKTSLEFWSTQF